MKNRREFLKTTVTGAVLLGAQSKLGLASMLDLHAEADRSKVVVARDPDLYGGGKEPDAKRVFDLLDRAITAYTGHGQPLEAWRSIAPQDKVVGLKVNGLGGGGISTHRVLVMAIATRLQQAGVKPGNILIWDRSNHDVEACGLSINTNPNQVRCFGTDVTGYEEQPEQWGTVSMRLSKILTRECATVINVPILKDHTSAGVTFAMKNMYGVIQRPFFLHGNGCNPAIADLNCFPTIRQKVRLTIGDAMSSIYEGGPVFHPQHVWYPNAVIVGEDPVAVDHTAWQMIERKRAEVGIPTLESAGRPPRYIATAADAAHRLGINDPNRIRLLQI